MVKSTLENLGVYLALMYAIINWSTRAGVVLVLCSRAKRGIFRERARGQGEGLWRVHPSFSLKCILKLKYFETFPEFFKAGNQ